MTETPPPRRALATFLRRPAAGATPPPAAAPTGEDTPAPEDAGLPAVEPAVEAADPPTASVPRETTPPVDTPATALAEPAQPAEPDVEPGPSEAEAAPAADLPAPAVEAPAESDAASISDTDVASPVAPTAEPVTDWRAAALPIAAPHAPTFARPRATVRAPRAPVWQWIALCVLALLLVMQILLADRARLATDARWRPLLATLCGALRCELPVWHEPSAFVMLDRDVRPASDQPGVLRIQASFRNDARWSQAWPYLQLSLSDADGRVIGSRVFAPEEYLGHAPPAGETLAPGQSGRIDFRVREPAAGTSAFTFDFH